MNAVALPLVLLGLATGVAIAPAARSTRAIGFVAFALLAGIVARLASPIPLDAALRGSWIVIGLCAGAIHLPRTSGRLALVFACASGGCAGMLAASSAALPEGYVLPPAIAALALASWCLCHGAHVAVKILASWLVAIALLMASLHGVPVTPGDRLDHLE
ncbi:hypothetical protein [Dokdonella sp.]|uniref:hypothetical protein n=1 Tax=Dokdonella sp. TaxID=2291710 RepID=UPI002F3FDA81